ncbi:Yip1 domain-containing protein [Treponema bryantii]|uniref:Yip1 domain-containing protein n=1 Tax=Treponema bryantii TaxID=163 RepID=A0A1I3MBG2_9SPIR|nr:Yip1 family protein [Treponema bryantii]SFI94308.1 Yip1 domain-containing protein [Treponema bryantii]
MSYITRRLKKLTDKSTYVRFRDTLKYSLYVIFHPADGFWDLIHAKRGSYAAANFIVILTLLTSVWRLRFTSFVVMNVHWEEVNIFEEFASILIPLLIFCVCNWALTTLFDGKGHLGDIYMGSAYALTPYPLIQIPIIILSNIVTKDEAAFYDVFNTISIIWCAVLIFMAMMMIHQYGFGKTLLFTIFTIFGMLIFIFIMLLFFSMISQGINYFVSLGREVIFRLN